MAGIVNKEFFGMKNENEGETNENNVLVPNPTASIVSEHERDELVCAVSPSVTHTANEILLYVDNQNEEGVHDLIRVALNQSMSTEELHQQLQEAGTNISLQNLGVGQTVISMDKERTAGSTEDDNKSASLNDGTLPVVRRINSDGTSTNIFQLASLSDTLSSEREQTFISTDLDIGGIKSESLEDEVDSTTIEDYIIANVNNRPAENTPAKSMSSSSLLHNIIRSLQGKLYVAEKKNDELQKKVEEQTQEIIRLRDRLANRYSSEEYLIPRRAGSNDFLKLIRQTICEEKLADEDNPESKRSRDFHSRAIWHKLGFGDHEITDDMIRETKKRLTTHITSDRYRKRQKLGQSKETQSSSFLQAPQTKIESSSKQPVPSFTKNNTSETS